MGRKEEETEAKALYQWKLKAVANSSKLDEDTGEKAIWYICKGLKPVDRYPPLVLDKHGFDLGLKNAAKSVDDSNGRKTVSRDDE